MMQGNQPPLAATVSHNRFLLQTVGPLSVTPLTFARIVLLARKRRPRSRHHALPSGFPQTRV